MQTIGQAIESGAMYMMNILKEWHKNYIVTSHFAYFQHIFLHCSTELTLQEPGEDLMWAEGTNLGSLLRVFLGAITCFY